MKSVNIKRSSCRYYQRNQIGFQTNPIFKKEVQSSWLLVLKWSAISNLRGIIFNLKIPPYQISV